jgi:hypothetical protein
MTIGKKVKRIGGERVVEIDAVQIGKRWSRKG